MGDHLRAPFPWFGGKSRAAPLLWPRFGDVPNYVEPFFGSGAVLLARPHAPRIETVNDVDALICNFWRSIKLSPEETAKQADGPVDEADLHSKHRWLVSRKAEIKALIMSDPEAHDPKVAGWWVWGLCAWIGSGWCAAEPDVEMTSRLPMLGGSGDEKRGNAHPVRGVHSRAMRGPATQLPDLGGNKSNVDDKKTNLGRGIHAASQRTRILDTFERLSVRLRTVRVACGDFERILSDSVTWRHGTTAILLDPEYPDGADVYAHSDKATGTDHVWYRAARWAVEHGEDTRLRIALCGYADTWSPPSRWEEIAWKSKGGYGSQSKTGDNANSRRERIWFSPGCLKTNTGGQTSLLGMLSKEQR